MKAEPIWFWVEGVGFGGALLLGVGMAFHLLRGRMPRIGWGILHATLATMATIVLIVWLSGLPRPDLLLDDAALFFAMAFLGGLTLAGLQLAGYRAPGVIVFLHGMFAAFAMVLFVVGASRL
jgi:hypothetical protein